MASRLAPHLVLSPTPRWSSHRCLVGGWRRLWPLLCCLSCLRERVDEHLEPRCRKRTRAQLEPQRATRSLARSTRAWRCSLRPCSSTPSCSGRKEQLSFQRLPHRRSQASIGWCGGSVLLVLLVPGASHTSWPPTTPTTTTTATARSHRRMVLLEIRLNIKEVGGCGSSWCGSFSLLVCARMLLREAERVSVSLSLGRRGAANNPSMELTNKRD